MSKETLEWLNRNTLIGFTEKRGNAWHHRASEQGAEPNHYPLAVPVDDVLRRLFNFTVKDAPLYVEAPESIVGFDVVPGKKAMVTSDTNEVLGLFSDGYTGHSYEEWLLENVATLLDEGLAIGSAGLLRNRGVAWVQIEMPDSFKTDSGVEFRPQLLAATSYDGTLATTYKRTAGIVVCDNTLNGALFEKGQTYKVKHTRYSNLRVMDAREALQIVMASVDQFMAEVDRLCAEVISEIEWSRALDKLVPVPTEEGRGKTMAENKRARLGSLWAHDPRVAPWRNTSFGVLQAFNTYDEHDAIVRGAMRPERNMLRVLSGQRAEHDSQVLGVLAGLKF